MEDLVAFLVISGMYLWVHLAIKGIWLFIRWALGLGDYFGEDEPDLCEHGYYKYFPDADCHDCRALEEAEHDIKHGLPVVEGHAVAYSRPLPSKPTPPPPAPKRDSGKSSEEIREAFSRPREAPTPPSQQGNSIFYCDHDYLISSKKCRECFPKPWPAMGPERTVKHIKLEEKE